MAVFSAAALSIFFNIIGAQVRFSSTVMWGKRLNCWNTMPIFCRCWLRFMCLSMRSSPSKMTCPPSGRSSRFRQRRKVDLPEPEGPMTHITSPLLISTLTPLRASLPSKTFLRFLTLITLCKPPLQLLERP